MLVSMDEAEKMAADFIQGKKSGYEVEVRVAEQTEDGWIVEGSATKKTGEATLSDNWTVTIQDEEVTNHKFEGGFAIT